MDAGKGAKSLTIRMTVNDPKLLNEKPEYSKMSTLQGEFLVIYGLTNHKIVEGFNKGDSRCIESLQNYVDHLARGLSSIVNTLDPDIIVLGGGMSNIEYIYDNINKELKKYVFSNTLHTKVVKNIHGDSGGVRGAAWL